MFAFNQLGGASANPNKDLEVTSPPEDAVSSLEFSPPSVQQTFLIAGSWDCRVRFSKCSSFTAYLTNVLMRSNIFV